MRRFHALGRCRRSGVTLVELAIVLLVAGLLIGFTWVAGESTWSNYRLYRINQQLVKLTQNIREYYMNAQVLPTGNGGNITALLDGVAGGVNPPNGLFPLEMRRNQTGGPSGTIDHPYSNSSNYPNGSLQVWQVGCPPQGPAACFRVQLLGLSQQACTQLLTFLPINNTDLGIVQVSAPLSGFVVQYPIALLTTSQAQSSCQPGVTNEIDLDFKLHN